jgi:hypothetical protein
MPLLKEHFAGKLPGGFGDISAALKQQQCSPLLIVGVPLFSIASFITASWGVRTLALHTPGAVRALPSARGVTGVGRQQQADSTFRPTARSFSPPGPTPVTAHRCRPR